MTAPDALFQRIAELTGIDLSDTRNVDAVMPLFEEADIERRLELFAEGLTEEQLDGLLRLSNADPDFMERFAAGHRAEYLDGLRRGAAALATSGKVTVEALTQHLREANDRLIETMRISLDRAVADLAPRP